MQEVYISLETAKLAKEKGFNLLCKYGYDNLEEGHRLIGTLRDFDDAYRKGELRRNSNTRLFTAPSQCALQKWLREVHNIEVDVLRYTYSGGVYQGRKYMWVVDQYDEQYNHELPENDSHWIMNERKSQGYDFNIYENALEEGLKCALTLIK